MNNYFFSFGTAEHFPFRDGYVCVQCNGDSYEALALFRSKHPDNTLGVGNFAFMYEEAEFVNSAMLRTQCHEYIRSEELILQQMTDTVIAHKSAFVDAFYKGDYPLAKICYDKTEAQRELIKRYIPAEKLIDTEIPEWMFLRVCNGM